MNYIEPQEAAIKIGYLIRKNNQHRCCITKKEILKITQLNELSSVYFVRVKEILEEFGIGIFQPQNRSEYILIDFNKIASGSKLSVQNLVNIDFEEMKKLVRNTKNQKIDIDPLVQTKNRISTLWAILNVIAHKQETISYKQIVIESEDTFTHHRQIDTPLEIIKQICLDYEYPRLDLLVFKESTGLPKCFHLDDNEKWKSDKNFIYESIKNFKIQKIDWDKYL